SPVFRGRGRDSSARGREEDKVTELRIYFPKTQPDARSEGGSPRAGSRRLRSPRQTGRKNFGGPHSAANRRCHRDCTARADRASGILSLHDLTSLSRSTTD